MKNLAHKSLATRIEPTQAILLCPACSSEIDLQELIERKGYVGCVNCAR